MNKKVWQIIGWTTLIGGMILYQGSRTGEVSHNYSQGLVSLFYKEIPEYGSLQYKIFLEIGRIVRKLGHVVEYFVLGLAMFQTVKLVSKKISTDRQLYARSALAVLSIATVDEVIQTMISGRNGQLSDVILDMFGCSVALLICRHRIQRQVNKG